MIKLSKFSKWYLSCAMTGLPNYNFKHFIDCEAILSINNLMVLFKNPARMSKELAEKTNRNINKIPKEEYLRYDLEAIENCDGIIMLYGWQQSQGGAQIELAHAIKHGKKVLYADKNCNLFDHEIEFNKSRTWRFIYEN